MKKLLGWGITLTNNETNDIKVIKFFENRGILLLSFLASLIRAGLPLMKNVLKHLAKSVLPAVVSATNTAVQKNCWIGDEINYKRNNLLKIKDGAYVIILDEYKSIRTHWIALYVNGNILWWLQSWTYL